MKTKKTMSALAPQKNGAPVAMSVYRGTVNDTCLPRNLYVNPDGTQPRHLSEIDRRDLWRYEAVIRKGLVYFVAVGLALGEIRDRGLHLDSHKSFPDYCRDRWHMKKSHAYRLIDAARVVRMMSPIGDESPLSVKPICESQVRPLVGLSREHVLEVWKSAAHDAPNGKITAKLVAKKAAELRVAYSYPVTKPSPAKPAAPQVSKVTCADILLEVEAAITAVQSNETEKALACLEKVKAKLVEIVVPLETTTTLELAKIDSAIPA